MGSRFALGLLVVLGLSLGKQGEGHAAATTRCGIVNATGVSFGAYDTRSPRPLDSVGVISFQCTGLEVTDTVSIELNRGRAGNFQPRAMAGRSPRFEYNLYLDAARTVIWGDGSTGTATYTARPVEGRTMSVSIYGRITPRQNVRPGLYEDTVVVTLMY